MKAKVIALGGVTAALAVTIMCLGGIIPLSTFICPTICCLLLQLCARSLGKSGAWTWYAAVSILVMLLGPDKEAAAVFVFLGYYPIIRSLFPKGILGWLLKLVYFNISILVMYFLLLNLFGMAQLAAEFSEMGTVLMAVALILGNVTFVLLDRLLMLAERRFG